MSGESVSLIITLTIFISNMIVLFQLFSSKIDLRVSAGLLLMFTVCELSAELLLGPWRFDYGGLRGLLYFPLLLFLLNGTIFQKLFAFFLELVFTVSLSLLIGEIVWYLVGGKFVVFQVVYMSLVLGSCIAYVALVTKYRRVIYEKLFSYGSTIEWVFYSIVGLFSFGVMVYSRMTKASSLYFVIILVFVLLSFSVLCFTIVNANEKSRQRYEAEFAREIISSGRDHYQKMDEMYDKLRALRHDYKYHLTTIGELLAADNKEEIERYLNDVQTQFSKIEMPLYCTNTVINALLTGYAERCAKLRIEYTVEVILPEKLPVPNYEMCIVLGNLLENAVEACQKADDKKIQILLKPVSGQLALRSRNSYDGRLNIIDGQIRSMKKDGGFGLKSIEAVAAKYGGELLTEWTDDTFTAYVAIRL